jgi:hypothetical protein
MILRLRDYCCDLCSSVTFEPVYSRQRGCLWCFGVRQRIGLSLVRRDDHAADKTKTRQAQEPNNTIPLSIAIIVILNRQFVYSLVSTQRVHRQARQHCFCNSYQSQRPYIAILSRTNHKNGRTQSVEQIHPRRLRPTTRPSRQKAKR